MNSITLELIRFTVDKSFNLFAPAFTTLRQTVKTSGVKEQYYGLTDDNSNQLLWVIDESSQFRRQINALDVNSKHVSWLVPFRFAGRSPSCLDCACMRIRGSRLRRWVSCPIFDSLHKTFTDCYHAHGFTGGNWGIATNSNDRVCLYVIGWESRAHHAEYSKSPLFDVEIDKLKPHFAPGSMGLYSKLTQELS
ncbi:hypothetical protein J3R30DRAFT_3656233 [Lentinula aciculospora]|uniref:Uncharacterized protein n=1 Tax=Lentinula aciculospora TaxID=153920 RepID=A0A9W9AHP4_9AGAR|nr:hypothetical protein J3R30DRAFT_3656233 [Lentinula aciculospora]